MIKINNISKSFGEKKVLESVSVELPETGIFALVGKSGSGKTTLMRILAGLERPDSGEIIGTENKKIGVVFQEDRLLPQFTALENIAIVCDKARAGEWLKKVELAGEEGKRVTELSGGMRRRVALARGLAYAPDLLLLDEPFKGLDPALRDRMLTLVERFAKSRPVLLITHSAKEAAMASSRLEL